MGALLVLSTNSHGACVPVRERIRESARMLATQMFMQQVSRRVRGSARSFSQNMCLCESTTARAS
eukprot:8651957-Alexandrium_andersonii.AAC.1